jgi:hypothetical protein
MNYFKEKYTGKNLEEFKLFELLGADNFIEIKKIKTFVAPHKHTYLNIPTMLMIKYTNGKHPINTGGWGSSSPIDGDIEPVFNRGVDIYNYNLTLDEINELLKDVKEYGVSIITSTSFIDNKHIPRSLDKRSDCDYIVFDNSLKILKEHANEKFSKIENNTLFTFTINGLEFQYIQKYSKTTSYTMIDVEYRFHFFDENDMWYGGDNYEQAIWG